MKKKIIIITLIILLPVLIAAAVISAPHIAFDIVISRTSGETAQCDTWELILINSDYHIPENYTFNKLELSNGQCVDERIYPDLQQMFDDMRNEGVYPFVREGYRTAAQQKAIMAEVTEEYMQQGYSLDDAYSAARTTVAAVGNSEHQLGLAVDINADLERCELWDVYNWLDANAYKYGFILRYPENKTDITGIAYEPWHYRYVGKNAAQEIYSKGICLEEYING